MYTPSEVAEIFAVDSRTIRRWIDEKMITAIQLPSKHWRIDSAEVERIKRDGFSARLGAAVEAEADAGIAERKASRKRKG